MNDDARVARELEEEREAHEARERELRGRLALAEATARELRSEVQDLRREPIVIGDHEAPTTGFGIAEDARDDGPHPTLRLYGVPEQAPISAFDAGSEYERAPIEDLDPMVPALASALGPLPTTAPPTSPLVLERPQAPPRAIPDPASEAYRRALGALRDRRYAEAVQGFSAFVTAHPGSRFTPSALYWRAEATYAMRDYRGAARSFEAFLAQSRGHEREPDALLKLSLCHRNVGDVRGAEAVVRRLRAEHPNSLAARLASRGEETSR